MSSVPASRRFEIPRVATFEDAPGGLTRLNIQTALAQATLYLQGAHLTHFQPAGATPVLFMSAASHFAPGKPIRGGVPICFPWFAARDGHPEAPAHGFARTKTWEIESLAGSAEQGVTVVLRLASDDETRALWPHEFVARFRVEVARQLTMTLQIENTSAAPFEFEEALHTYFAVSDVRHVSVTGLENAAYIDKTDALARKQLGAAPLRIASETDRLFPGTGTTATCVIHDPGLTRQIVVEKTNSDTTVVWNPWIAKAAKMPDFGDDEWPRMLCIESANAGAAIITLAPGAKHAMTQTVRLG